MSINQQLNVISKIEKLVNLSFFNPGVYFGFVQSMFRFRLNSPLRNARKAQGLTQQELAAKSGVSINTIQRIEAGMEPKGQILADLSRALFVPHSELQHGSKEPPALNYTVVKLINLSSLPLTVLPPFNIVLPLLMMFCFQQWNQITKQLLSLQLLWTILSFVLFVLCAFSRTWLSLNPYYLLAAIVILVFVNMTIILANAFNIDKNNKPIIHLNFNLF